MDLIQQLRRLTGRTVMVDPQLAADPDNRKEQYGKIVSALLSKDCFTVLFDDNKRSNFNYEALLILIPKKLLKLNYMHSVGKLESKYSKTIVKSLLLLHHGKEREALQSATQNDVVKPLCVVNCKQWAEIVKSRNGMRRQKQKRT